MNRIRLCTVLACAALVLLAGCDPEEAESSPEVSAIPVETKIVGTQAFVDRVNVSAVVKPVHDVRVAAEAPGRVLSASFEEGERVKRGQLLLRVDSQVDSARIDVLRSQVATARREYERTKTLARQGLSTPQQLDQASSQVDQASLNLKQAQVAVGKSSVRSPIEGYVATKAIEKGEYINPGQLLAHIVDYDTVQVEASVPERDIRYTAVGMEVDVEVPALDTVRRGTVQKRAIVATEQSRTFAVEIHVENPDLELLPGMRARVSVPRKDFGEVVMVPRSAILEGFERSEALIVDGDGDEGRATVREVVLGPGKGSMVVIEEGLEAGDRLITKGHRGIADGTRVRVVSEAKANGSARAEAGQKPNAAEPAKGDASD